ncbi:hypothetical protein EGW08_012760 [Elysia chlorotica]|uniref:Synapsin ATP-binding domain-containing protein n=1 Tax=Elysia chlorotica TaxID=188477 RepID=A0A3S0ZK16_ELYCH|nr:hypothetical protein EGW08_012760 [Elysia chlorotica]
MHQAMNGSHMGTPPGPSNPAKPPQSRPPDGSQPPTGHMTGGAGMGRPPQGGGGGGPHPGSSSSTSGQPSHMNNPPPQPFPTPNQGGLSRGASKDEEDTMKNLRKTFAGIFGDM